MKRLLYFIGIVALGSCLRLDSNLYNSEQIDFYQLDSYTGEREIADLPAEYNISPALVHQFSFISNDDGEEAKIYGIYLGDTLKIATDTVIMYCHGNKHHIDLYWNRAKLLANVGGKNRCGVLIIDYRGFGMSEGESTESGMYADVDAALAWLKSKGLTNDRLALYGFSLGSAPATELTAHPRSMTPHWLLLESPFANAEVMVQDASQLALPASYFTNLSINNAEEIELVQQPFYWLHGVDDDFLNIETHGQVVFDHYQGSYKEAHKIEGGVHNDVPRAMGYANYTESILSFLKNN
jgi:alpha/beta superfamily hydrolase